MRKMMLVSPGRLVLKKPPEESDIADLRDMATCFYGERMGRWILRRNIPGLITRFIRGITPLGHRKIYPNNNGGYMGLATTCDRRVLKNTHFAYHLLTASLILFCSCEFNQVTLAGFYVKDGQPVVQHLIQNDPGCMRGCPSFLKEADLAFSTVGARKFDMHLAMLMAEREQ